MGFLSRRRRFIMLVGVCCVSLVGFAWYTRSDALSEFSLPSFIEYSYPPSSTFHSDLNQDSSLKLKDETHEHQNIANQLEDDLDDLEYSDYDEAVTKSAAMREEELNSGPTEESVVKATTSKPVVVESESQGVDLVYSDEVSELPTTTSRAKPPHADAAVHSKGAGLIIDTDGCKIPKLDPWDATIINLYEAHEKLVCEGPPLFMRPQPNGIISLDEAVIKEFYDSTKEDMSCAYKAIKRKYEDSGNVRENDYTIGEEVPMKFDVPLDEDYVEVNCDFSKANKTFKQFFPLVRLRKEIEEDRNAKTPPEPRLNVILLGVDSVSKLNFLRHFNRTQAFLKNKLKPFDMKGYTKVADNTFPNLVPMLTGHFVEYYWNESLRDTMFFDNIDLIWKEYAKRGYRTFYAEDSPYTGTFNYIKRGFHDPPTDYYSRPLVLALENSDIREHSSSHCFNSQLETDLLYDYLKDFIKTMDNRPFTAFTMVSTMTHDYLNNAAYADDPVVRVLEDLHDSGALNNSMMVLFSDHGLRFGAIRQTYIGKFEERMPFMFVHFPQWFLDKHPDIAKNLKDSQNRLITLFDIHATMIHLLDLKKVMTPEEKAKVTQGLSLMGEIPTDRKCDDANILPHWCPCQTMEAVPLDGEQAKKSGQAIMDSINSQLSTYKACAKLDVDVISDARLGLANELVMTFKRHDNVVENRKVVYGDRVNPLEDYMITLTAKPGGAVFEGTVRRDTTQESYSVLGISRINMYGNSSWCVDSQKMKIYCYCSS